MSASIVALFDGEVPGEFWGKDVDEGGDEIAVVSCVCGGTPEVRTHRLAECSGCQRFFMHLGGTIRVARPPDEGWPSDGGRRLGADDFPDR